MTTTTISDLPEDLLAEIFFKVPLTCLKPIRLTCKLWNALSKTQIIGKARKETFIAFKDSRVCSVKLNLQGIRNNGENFVDPSVKQISVFNQVKISQVFHCDGLFLCVNEDRSSLLVWDPYFGQTRWIQPINNSDRSFTNMMGQNCFYHDDLFALGYDKNNRNHKILRILSGSPYRTEKFNPKLHEIYDLSSNSWTILDVNVDSDRHYYQNIGSLKGNTYFFGQAKEKHKVERCLYCFDFTAKRFGPRLSLPGNSYKDPCFEFCVKDEQLVLLKVDMTYLDVVDMEIWVSNKIDPDEVLWSKFLKVDKERFAGFPYDFICSFFFIDEEKKAAVIFGCRSETRNYQTAYYIVGTDGYFKSVNTEIALDNGVISSYVPNFVQLQTNHDITSCC